MSWESGGAGREVSYTTAVAAAEPAATESQAIGTISLFPSPATTDATGRPLQDLEVAVPLSGFTTGTLVHLSWSNAGGSAGAKTLTSTSGVTWRGTIPKEQVTAALVDGAGEVPFTVSVGGLTAFFTLAVQQATTNPPAVTVASIDRNPILIGPPGSGPTCANRNRCENTVDVTFAVTVTGLDPTQDAVIVQYQLFDGTFVEVPLAPNADRWELTVPARTTKFLTGSARAFRFTAIRTADGAAATTTVSRDVVST